MHWQSVLGVNYQLQAQPQMQKDFFIHNLAWNNKESNRLWRRELSSYLPPNWMRVWEPGRESKVCVRAAGRDRFRGRLKFSQTEPSFMCVIICCRMSCTLEHYGNPSRGCYKSMQSHCRCSKILAPRQPCWCSQPCIYSPQCMHSLDPLPAGQGNLGRQYLR